MDDFVNRDDVGVVDCGHRFRFAQEAGRVPGRIERSAPGNSTPPPSHGKAPLGKPEVELFLPRRVVES